jgi:hypothetical protein
MAGKMVKCDPPVKGEFRSLARGRTDLPYFSSQSPQRAGSCVPHGMIGTVDVEFLGEPSMILSE